MDLGPHQIDFAISTDDEGIQHAFGEGLAISVLPDAPDCHINHRRQIKIGCGGNGEMTGIGQGASASHLVCQLAGIRLYVRQLEPGKYSLIMTSQKVIL